MQRPNHSLLRSAKKKPLDFEGAVLLHVRIADLKVREWFGVGNKNAVDIPVQTSFMSCFVRGIISSIRRTTLRHSRPVYVKVQERKNEQETSSDLANDTLNVITEPGQDERRAADGETTEVGIICIRRVHRDRPTNHRIQTLMRRREQAMVSRIIANILPIVPFQDLETKLSKKMVHLLRKIGMEHGAECPTRTHSLANHPDRLMENVKSV